MRASRLARLIVVGFIASIGLVLPSTSADAITAPPEITTTSLPSVIQGKKYPTTRLTVTGGTWPYKWSVVSGSLPYGLTLSSGGVLGGATDYPFTDPVPVTIQVTDRKGLTAVRDFSIQVQRFQITTPSLKTGKKNAFYYMQLKSDGGCTRGKQLTWQLQNGFDPLPTGLKLSSTGAISGVPKVTGTANIRVRIECVGVIFSGNYKDFTLTVS